MGNSIKFKLGAVIGGLALLTIGTIISTFITLSAQESDSKVLNISGAQRMLSQKVTKEAMGIASGLSKGSEVYATIDTFEKNLNALISGDSARGIPATEDAETLSQLNKVSNMWSTFKEELDKTVTYYDRLSTAEGYIAVNNTILLTEMNKAVGMMERASFSANDVNLAGAQRMLSQKIAKEALNMVKDPTVAQTFMASVDRFDKVLNGFLKGDSSLGIDAVKNASIASQLNTVNDTWKIFKTHAVNLVEITSQLKTHTSYLMQNNVPLLQESNAAVIMYEKIARSKVDSLKNMMLAILVISVIVAIIGWVVVIKAVVNPVLEVVELSRLMAAGDLTHADLVVSSQDEIGSLTEALNLMKNSLNNIMSQINETATTISTSATELAATTNQIVQGTTRQSNQADQVATSMEEMSATVVEVARNSQNSAENANRAQETANAGKKIVTQTVEGMMKVADTVQKSSVTVEALGKSSEKIGEIVGVINDIADQTNLLALNAAIEAARAGEQGRGFAVVADEVRKLAEKTGTATKEIADMISRIQDETNGAIKSMHEGTEQVEKGVELASQAGKSLDDIVSSVEVVTDMVRQIATSAEQQSATAEEVSTNVSSIAEVSRETATGMKQVASSTDGLSSISEELSSIVATFKLEKYK